MRRIKVRVRTGKKREQVCEDATGLVVEVPAQPSKGRANGSVIRLLANYYDVSRSKIVILEGARSKLKTIGVLS
jgi:uncharacterized protein YggU (UPF0235/DUF167 family)